MKTLFIIIAILITIYFGYHSYRFAKMDNGLDSRIASGAIILDVRTASEYKKGHIVGALNMPLGTIQERYVELDPEKTYITTCSHGLRSIKVEQILKEKGFKHVYNGGRWVDLEKTISKL